MKYILVALVLLIAVQIWRSNRRKAAAPPPTRSHSKQQKPEEMVTCAHCGVHLPSSDALITPGAHSYCSSEHRQLGPR